MKFEISFDEAIFKEKMKLKFDLVWKKKLKNIWTCLLVLIPSLLIASIFLITGKGGKQLYVLIFISSLGVVFNIFFLRLYYMQKKKYFNKLNNEVKNALEIKINDIWEFDNEYFKITTNKFESKIKWDRFEGFREIEKSIFLDLNTVSYSSYILSKKEIGEDNYKKTILFLEQKLKKTYC